VFSLYFVMAPSDQLALPFTSFLLSKIANFSCSVFDTP
jgi:hypothetical protein